MKPFILLILLSKRVNSFQTTIYNKHGKNSCSNHRTKHIKSLHDRHKLHATTSKGKNWLMDDFKTADGYVINPYATLKVERDAPRGVIRQSYRKLSKKYHPDAARFSTIMPGKCDTQDDVRNEWERIKLSYEVLTDQKMRLKYDRQSALDDPGSAIGRAAFQTVTWGVSGLAKGIFSLGKFAVKSAQKKQMHDMKVEEVFEKGGPIVKSKQRIKKKRKVQHIQLETNSTSSTLYSL